MGRKAATVEHSDLNGKGAWKITAEGKRTTVWTSDDGKWDLLKVQGVKMTQKVGSEDLSTFEFSGPNAPVTVTKPTGVVKMSDLMVGK